MEVLAAQSVVHRHDSLAQRVPPTPGAGCAPGSFVTLLSGASHVPQALCLREQFRRVGSECPLAIIVDDSPAKRLGPVELRTLQDAYGLANVFNSSWLFSHTPPIHRKIVERGERIRRNDRKREARMGARLLAARVASGAPAPTHTLLGRRLFGDYMDYVHTTMLMKLHLWALPQSRCAPHQNSPRPFFAPCPEPIHAAGAGSHG